MPRAHLANYPPRIDPDAGCGSSACARLSYFICLLTSVTRSNVEAGSEPRANPYRLFHPARAALAPCGASHSRCDASSVLARAPLATDPEAPLLVATSSMVNTHQACSFLLRGAAGTGPPAASRTPHHRRRLC